MRLLILSQYFEPELGAPQVRLAAFARELLRLGHQVEVVTALPSHPLGRIFPAYRGRLYRRETTPDGLVVHRVWCYPAMGTGPKRMLNYLSFAVTALAGLVCCRRPDLLFVESPPLCLSLPGWIAARLWRTPMTFNVADLWPDTVVALGVLREGPALRLARRLETWSYARSRLVNAVTDGIRETLIRDREMDPARVTFLPNGVDPALFAPGAADPALAAELGLEGRSVILYAGTLGLAQGLDVALDAMKLVAPRRPEVLLVFLGDGSDRRRLEDRVHSERIPGVRFLDARPLPEVARLYRLAVAGLAVLRRLPLFEGARPSKLFPIMASALPVLYSGAGEGARLVTGAGAGLAAPPEDPEALAQALLQLLQDPEAARAMGRSGRAYAEAHLAWPRLVGDWLDQVARAGVNIR
jgi:glycosyltransferase involved in cell wall biosynthesis